VSRLPWGARVVRGLARAALFLYPARFRRLHGRAFPDITSHRWEREAARQSPLAATVTTTRLLAADTLAAAPMSWMEAATDENESRPSLRGVLRSLGRWLRDGGQDLRLAARAARRRPAFTLLVSLILGLGLGASTAAFDALDRAILNPLPFKDGERLRLLGIADRLRGFRTTPSLEAIELWREAAKRLDAIELFQDVNVTRSTRAGAELLPALAVSGGLPAMLGVRPVVGRMLGPGDAEDEAPSVVMLSEQFWRREFGGDPGTVGQTMPLAAGPAEIVGVWPAGARLDPRRAADVIRVLPAGREISQGSLAYVLVRLASEASELEAEQELATLMAGLPEASATAVPSLDDQAFWFLGEGYRGGVWLVFAGAVGLFLAALANASSLLIERATMRGHELGVRLALGGSGARLARLFIAEGVIYAAFGTAVAAGVAAGLERLVRVTEPRLFSELAGAGLDGRALGFMTASALLVALVCSMAPLWRMWTADLRAVIARSGVGRSTPASMRAHLVLVATQAALAVLLVSGAVLMIQSFRNLANVDSGVALDRLAELSVSPPAAHYPSPESQRLFHDRLRQALEAMPGVDGVTTSGMPILMSSIQSGLPRLEGEAESAHADSGAVTLITSAPPGYFKVLGIRLVKGRFFEAGERDIAIVSEGFAVSRGGEVVGKRVYTPRSERSYEIVGVVGATRAFGMADREERFNIYFPEGDQRTGFVRYIVRTKGDPDDVLRLARATLAEIDPALPMLGPQTGRDVYRRQTAQHRFVAMLLAGLASLGFLLALAGVYGAVALNLSRRTREVGIRLALGASARALVRTLTMAGLRPVVLGGALGAVVTWFASPRLDVLLFHVPPRDPWSLIPSIGVVLGAALLAALVPARRAGRVDPVITLRVE
jgi:putative ABC transport system permease protein